MKVLRKNIGQVLATIGKHIIIIKKGEINKMGDDAIDAMLYAINRETGEKFAIGKGITEIPKLAPGGVVNEKIENFKFDGSFECVVSLKKITKKRFIKLLMAHSYQKRQAVKMHNEYMQKHKARSRIGLELFVMTYGIKPNEFKIKVGGRF